MKYPQSANPCFRDGQRQLRLNSWVGWGTDSWYPVVQSISSQPFSPQSEVENTVSFSQWGLIDFWLGLNDRQLIHSPVDRLFTRRKEGKPTQYFVQLKQVHSYYIFGFGRKVLTSEFFCELCITCHQKLLQFMITFVYFRAGFFAAASFMSFQHCIFNFGAEPFK